MGEGEGLGAEVGEGAQVAGEGVAPEWDRAAGRADGVAVMEQMEAPVGVFLEAESWGLVGDGDLRPAFPTQQRGVSTVLISHYPWYELGSTSRGRGAEKRHSGLSSEAAGACVGAIQHATRSGASPRGMPGASRSGLARRSAHRARAQGPRLSEAIRWMTEVE